MIKYPASMWYAINSRCLEGGAHQKKRPKYVGCTNCFSSIDDFKDWAMSQPGFGLRDSNGKRFNLDKDLILPGNKVYCREYCSLIPARINTLMLDCGAASSGDLPGAAWHPASNRYQARVQTFNGRKYLGIFKDKESAHAAWRAAKASVIREAVLWYSGIRGVDHRVVESLLRQAELLDREA